MEMAPVTKVMESFPLPSGPPLTTTSQTAFLHSLIKDKYTTTPGSVRASVLRTCMFAGGQERSSTSLRRY